MLRSSAPPPPARTFLIVFVSLLVILIPTLAGSTPTTWTGPGVAGQIHALTFDANSSGSVFIGGDTFGVQRSADLGQTWQFMSVGLENRHGGQSMYVEDLLSLQQSVVPVGAPKLYAATRGGIYSYNGNEWQLMTPPEKFGYGYDSSGTARSGMIWFSALAYDGSRYLYAGAGHARTDQAESTLEDIYTLVPPSEFDQVLQGPAGQYSLWRCDLDSTPLEWNYIGDSVDHGPVRSITHYEDGAGIDHVIFSTPSGIYDYQDDGTPELVTLTTPDKTSPPEAWSGNSWDVECDASGQLFVLNLRSEDDQTRPCIYCRNLNQAGGFVALGDTNAMVAVSPDSMTWGGFLTAQSGGEYLAQFSTLSIRSNDDGSTDVVIGNNSGTGESPSVGGGFLHARVAAAQAPGTATWRNLMRYDPWGILKALPMDTQQSQPQILASGDLGWAANVSQGAELKSAPELSPTVPFAFCPQSPDTLLAWLYHFPLVSTDDGASWGQAYCDGSHETGWTGRGCNEMSVTDVEHFDDGKLAVTCRDWGVWKTTGPGGDTYRELFTYENLVRTDKITTRGDSLYCVLWTSPDSTLAQVEGSIAKYSESTGWSWLNQWTAFDGTPPRHFIQDYTLDPLSGRVYAIATDPTEITDFDHWSSTVLLGVPDGTGTWDWYRIFEMQKRRYMDILLLPGRDKLILADMDTRTLDTSGGIYCIDLEDIPEDLNQLPLTGYSPQTWLDGDPYGDFLHRAVRRSNVLATDPGGNYLYVGTSGEEYSSTIVPGTVLRVGGPFLPHVVPAAESWEILANEAWDSFSVGPHAFHGGWTPVETAQRMTTIRDLLVHPDNRNVVYAAVEAEAMHPSNGVWVWNGGENWSAVAGISGNQALPNRAPSALSIWPDTMQTVLEQTPRSLVIGTYGQELFSTTLDPVTTIVSEAEFVDRSPLVQAQGMDYSGEPYASISSDYSVNTVQDTAALSDLIITFLDAPPLAYLNTAALHDSVPLYEDFTSLLIPDLNSSGYRGVSLADFDNDGWTDLFVAHATTPKLLRNAGGSGGVVTYTDVTSIYGLETLLTQSWTGIWCDYDRDGYVDLFVGRGGSTTADPLAAGAALSGLPDVLLQNRTWCGEGFVDVSHLLAVPAGESGCTLSAAWLQADGDGWPDLFVCDAADSSRSRLWMNQDGQGFTDETAGRFVTPLPDGIHSVTAGDVNESSYPDLLLAVDSGIVYRHGMTFGVFGADVPVATGVQFDASGAVLTDHDLDGVREILVLSYDPAEAPRLVTAYRPSSGITFLDISSEAGLAVADRHRTAQIADATGDGDPDLYLGVPAQSNETFFYQNKNLSGGDEPESQWYGVQVVGDGGTNVSGIGAEVILYTNGGDFHRDVFPEWGLGSGTAGPVIIGMGPGMKAYGGEVIWPDGTTTVFKPEVRKIVRVDDAIAPLYQANSFSAAYVGLPNSALDLVFEWTTLNAVDPARTRVHLTNLSGSGCSGLAGTLAPVDPEADYTVTRMADGTYEHRFVWSGGCVPRCSYDAEAYCETRSGDFTTETILLRVPTCLTDYNFEE